MFRKLVSSLPFSPALVGQLGFYARRLSREQAARRLGFIFTALAVMVQVFALVSPPEQTYAASPSNECAYNSALTKDDTDCIACSHNPAVWFKSAGCNDNTTLSIEALNLSQNGAKATSSAANPTDRIQYNLTTKNTSSSSTTVAIGQNVSDLLEYATVIDTGGGTFNQTDQTVSWGTVTLEPGQTDSRSFVVQLNDSFANTPQAADDPSSYDCVLGATYGNTINVSLNCPLGKQLESTVKQLPETGMGLSVAISTLIVMVAAYLYARSRQMSREMRILRKEYNVG